jgi:hypothetical protein
MATEGICVYTSHSSIRSLGVDVKGGGVGVQKGGSRGGRGAGAGKGGAREVGLQLTEGDVSGKGRVGCRDHEK